jgi:amino acid permease
MGQNMFPVFQGLEKGGHKQMAVVSWLSIGLCAAVYFLVGVFGYFTFLRRAETSKVRAFRM